MHKNGKSVQTDSIRTYGEFLRRYFPKRAQELLIASQDDPYTLGVSAASRSLEELGLERTAACLSCDLPSED